MSNFRTFGWMAVLVLPLIGVGCQRTFTVAVTNNTPEDLYVSLEGPGVIRPEQTVPVAGDGGQAMFRVRAYDHELPSNYSWYAGPYRGSVIVDDVRRDRYTVDIEETGYSARMRARERVTVRDETARGPFVRDGEAQPLDPRYDDDYDW